MPTSAKLALLFSMSTLLACTTRTLGEPTPVVSRGDITPVVQSTNRDLDILFVVDDSSSMQLLQDKLTANFPAFMQVLEALPLPNVHIAVVSSDLGAGRFQANEVPGCRHGGDQGKFQFAPRGACAKGRLDDGQTFLSNINGRVNYTGDIADAFGCIADLGQAGCGMEHQFGSMLRALGADGHGGAPAENAGFLRPGAWLAVVIITNEDDCSAPLESSVFDPASKYVTDPLGPQSSYRCNFVGHLCDGKKLPLLSGGTYKDCVSAEDGVLLRVSDVVAGLKGLKADPNKILVAAIAGPPQPYVVTDDMPPTNDDPAGKWPQVNHSCTQADGTNADPGVRLWDWVHAFGANGLFETICRDSLTPALMRIGEVLGNKISHSACVTGQILDASGAPWASGDAPGPDCSVVEHAFDASGAPVDTVLPSCAASPSAPCWRLEPAAAGACAAGDHVLKLVNHDPDASSLDTTLTCAMHVCPAAGAPNPPPGCP
ncbi:MAG: hypothetical protein JWM82_4259 [Myxococcales bacterium]|nr:hypothetical protein [Myxococcales bacterium]